MSFAQAARRLAGQAGLLLGWRPDTFWAVTPDELAAALAPLSEAFGPEMRGFDRAELGRLMEGHPDG
jgi:uncharacterized phage protein (TIGR02216 family)